MLALNVRIYSWTNYMYLDSGKNTHTKTNQTDIAQRRLRKRTNIYILSNEINAYLTQIKRHFSSDWYHLYLHCSKPEILFFLFTFWSRFVSLSTWHPCHPLTIHYWGSGKSVCFSKQNYLFATMKTTDVFRNVAFNARNTDNFISVRNAKL